jgi:uncharacterized protein (DUF885 family)
MQRKHFSFILWSLFFAGSIWVVNTIWFMPFDIDDFYERTLIEYAIDQPEALTRFRIGEQFGVQLYNDQLSDLSLEENENRYHHLVKDFEMLRSYKRSKQSASQLVSTDVLDIFLENEVHERSLFRNYAYPINHINGAHLELPFFMATQHSIQSLSDAEDYAHRLNQFEVYFEQLVQQLQNRQDSSLYLPNFMIDKVLEQMGSFITTPSQQNILYTEFAKKISRLQHISPNSRAELSYEVRVAIEQVIYPTYRKMIQYLDSLRESNPPQITEGVWQLKKGELYYFFLLKKYTGNDVSPEELHQVGLAEVESINAQMREILDSLGFSPDRPVMECLKEVYQRSDFQYDSTQKKQFLAEIDQEVAQLEDLMHYHFEQSPKADLKIAPTPSFKAKYAPMIDYESSSLNAETPAACYLNLSSMRKWHHFEKKAWVCQEIFLGKHLLSAVQREAKLLPTFRRIIDFEAFSRGWASYVLTLANEANYFKNAYEKLGMLHLRLINAASMVVDTGIHYKHWNRQYALGYMSRTTCLSEAQQRYHVDYSIVFPAKLCAYYAGNQRILQLRQEAKNQLGDKFDLKEFHDAILSNGSLPLDVLTKIVHSYIERTKRGK